MPHSIMDNPNINLQTLDEINELSKFIPHRLTAFQTKILDNQLYTPDSVMWNLAKLLQFSNEIDANRLKKAIQKFINCHPAFETRIFIDQNGETMQQYTPGFLGKIQVENVSEEEFSQICDTLIQPFQMINAPLTRIRLFKTPDHVYFFMDTHHILMDGISAILITRDIGNIYNNLATNCPTDYLFANMWQDYQNSKTDKYKEAKEYYSEKFENCDWYNIPTPDFSTRKNDAGEYIFLTEITTTSVREAERRCRMTRARLAIAANLVTLAKYSGKSDVLTTWIFGNRTNKTKENILGLLIKELPVGVHLNKSTTIAEFYKNINEQIKKTTLYADYDYVLLNESVFTNDSIEINYQLGTFDLNSNEIDFSGNKAFIVPIKKKDKTAAEARMEIDIFEVPCDGKDYSNLQIRVLYMSSIYKKETIQNYVELFQNTLKTLIEAQPTDTLASILD